TGIIASSLLVALLLLWRGADAAAVPLAIAGAIGALGSGLFSVIALRLRKSVQRANTALRDSEIRNHRYRNIIFNAPDAILMVDREGAICACNTRAEELFGYSRTEMVGRPVEMLLPDRMHARHRGHRTEFDPQMQGLPMAARRNVLGRHRDGTEMALDIALSVEPDVDTARFIVFVRDMRERERLQQALLQ